MMCLGFERHLADPCVFRLFENGHVSIMAVVYVDDVFAPGRKSRCDEICDELNTLVPINNLGDLTWYGGCQSWRDKRC